MSLAKITLIGFYNYDNTLFDNIILPSGIDKDTLVNNILLDGGEFEVLYGNPIFYKNAVEHFFKLNYDLFNKWVDTMSLEYNPIENYDRMETWSNNESEDSTTNMTGSASSQSSDTSSGQTSTTNQVSSFDASSNLVDDTKSTGSASNTASGTNSSSTTDRSVYDKDVTSSHTGRVHGNIGVKTTQSMIEETNILNQKWQLIKIITDMFINELLIAVYE